MSDPMAVDVAAFADLVMAAVAREPGPTSTRNFISAIRGRSAQDAAAALLTAWHLGTFRSWRIARGFGCDRWRWS